MSDDVHGIGSLIHGGGQNRSFFRLVPAPLNCMPLAMESKLGVGQAAVVLTAQERERARPGHSRSKNSYDPQCGRAEFIDDGIQLFAGVALLAQCVAFLGLQVSNIGRAVVELGANLRFPPTTYDVLNDLHRADFEGERVWYGAVGVPRPISQERLAGHAPGAAAVEAAAAASRVPPTSKIRDHHADHHAEHKKPSHTSKKP